VPDDISAAPLTFLRAVFEPDDWVAVFLKSYVDGRVVQRVASVVWAASDPVQAWLRAMNAHRFNVYVAWNWIACFFSPDASFIFVTERPSEEEKGMTADDVRWDQYPSVAATVMPRAWLAWQANRQLAKHTIETYGRSLEDFLLFLSKESVRPEDTTRAHVAAYVRELLTRRKPRQSKVVHLDSGAGLANATILLRLSVIRLFFDHLVEEGLRITNPAVRMQWRRRYGRTPGHAPLIRRHRRLPWIPTEEQWQALLS
jgi:Phage integrase, N-terminal SAM-like domain